MHQIALRSLLLVLALAMVGCATGNGDPPSSEPPDNVLPHGTRIYYASYTAGYGEISFGFPSDYIYIPSGASRSVDIGNSRPTASARQLNEWETIFEWGNWPEESAPEVIAGTPVQVPFSIRTVGDSEVIAVGVSLTSRQDEPIHHTGKVYILPDQPTATISFTDLAPGRYDCAIDLYEVVLAVGPPSQGDLPNPDLITPFDEPPADP